MSHPRGAFSLIEVVAAVAIFSLGIVVALGLFVPVTKSISAGAEAETAARLAGAVRARLAALPFASALSLVRDPAISLQRDADGVEHPDVIFGTLTGEIGLYDASATPRGWYNAGRPPRIITDAEKFFEIDLIRNETISPVANDATAAMVAFAVRVHWPFRPATDGTVAHSDPGRRRVLVFSGFITR